MKQVLFLTNYASPYRVWFFEELSQYFDVTVLFSERIAEKKHRDASWFVAAEGKVHYVQLEKRAASIHGKDLCTDVISWLKKPYDQIVICGYSSPTAMLAMAYLKCRKIPFCMEIDGGLVRPDSGLKLAYKKLLVGCASQWLCTGREPSRFLAHYGADPEKIRIYPFSSLFEKDILAEPVSAEEKAASRQRLGMTEKHIVLCVGQFIPRKGFDILLQGASKLLPDTGIYFVGGVPTEEYRRMAEACGEARVHFVGFQKKESLAQYYQAADVFAMPTREDIWGLVINEAMANGLPVVTTDRCVAGLELVRDGVNGCIVPVEDADAMAAGINRVLEGDCAAMGAASLEIIRPYTIENMAKVHADIFSQE